MGEVEGSCDESSLSVLIVISFYVSAENEELIIDFIDVGSVV